MKPHFHFFIFAVFKTRKATKKLQVSSPDTSSDTHRIFLLSPNNY